MQETESGQTMAMCIPVQLLWLLVLLITGKKEQYWRFISIVMVSTADSLYAFDVTPSITVSYIFIFSGVSCDIQMTQATSFLSTSLGDHLTINCRSNKDINKYLAWVQQKPGKAPRMLIHFASTLLPGVPAKFEGSGSGTDFSLTVRNMESQDIAMYYCLQYSEHPSTMIQAIT